MRETGGFPTIWSFCFGGGWRLEGGGGVPAGLGMDRGLRPLSPPTANPPDPTPTEYPCPRAAWPRQTPLS